MTKTLVEKEIVNPPYKCSLPGEEIFPSLHDDGWEFELPAPRTFPVVVTPLGVGIVGEPDEDGVLCRGGVTWVVTGDVQQARENSIQYTPGCKATTVRASKLKIGRGFGRTPVLLLAQPVLVAEPAVS